MESAISNRRRCVRQNIHSPAYVSTASDPHAILLDLNEVFDISVGGMSFQSPAQLKIAECVNLRLDFSATGDSLEAPGWVAWSEPSGRSGVRFQEMPESSFWKLKEWLFLNLIAACVQYENSKRRAQDSFPQPVMGQSGSGKPISLGTDPKDLPETAEYATMLITLAAIRHEIEAYGPGMQPALQRLVEHACTLVCASGAAIAVSDGRDMICRAHSGDNVPGLGTRIEVESSFSGECIRTGKLLRCDDSDTDPLVDRDSCRALAIRSMMAIPLRHQDAIIGLLEVFSPQPQIFRWRDEVYLRRLGEISLASVKCAMKALKETPAPANTSLPAANPETVEADPLGFGSAARVLGQSSAVELAGFDPKNPSGDASTVPSGFEFARIRNFALTAVAAIIVLAGFLLAPSLRRQADVAEIPRSHSASQNSPPAKSVATAVGELENLRQEALDGDATAQFALGARYATGEDVGQDYGEAALWFSRAAEQGHVTAQATLGAYYWFGRGVPQNFDKAYFWSMLARAGGDEASKYRIPTLASRLTREEMIADQDQANDWIKRHQLASKNSHPGSGNSKD